MDVPGRFANLRYNFSIFDVSGSSIPSSKDALDMAEHLDLRQEEYNRADENGGELSDRPVWARAVQGTYEAGKAWWRRAQIRLRTLPTSPTAWAFLSVLGILSALLGAFIDYVIDLLAVLRLSIVSTFSGFWLCVIWVTFCVALSVSASLVSGVLDVQADGSGIPQLKSVLSGGLSVSLLSFTAMIAKIVGVALSNGAGLSVGKMGPFVFISAVLAQKMLSLPCFHSLRGTSAASHRQFIAAGVAAGVTAVLGAPIGGVLFSIETTATYYAVGNMWRAFIAAVCCVLTFSCILAIRDDELFPKTSFDFFEIIDWETIAFVFLGVIVGVFSVVFVYLVGIINQCRRRSAMVLRDRAMTMLIIAVITSMITLFIAPLRTLDKAFIGDMFSDSSLASAQSLQWGDVSAIYSLSLYIVAKTFLTILPCGAPVPAGLFTPIFTIGAALGRFFGEALNNATGGAVESPAAYAVVAAAALSAGCSHAVSPCVIVFELTGQLSHMIPVIFAVLVSDSIGTSFSPSLYDLLGDMRGLPRLPALRETSFYKATAEAFVQTRIPVLTMKASWHEVRRMVQSALPIPPLVPVVEDPDSMILVGGVNRDSLFRFYKAVHFGDYFDANQDVDAGDRTRLAELKIAMDATLNEQTAKEMPVGTSDWRADVKQIVQWIRDKFRSSLERTSFKTDVEAAQEELAWKNIHPERLFTEPFGTGPVHVEQDCPQVQMCSPASQLQFLFTTCGWQEALVVSRGRLVGILQAADLSMACNGAFSSASSLSHEKYQSVPSCDESRRQRMASRDGVSPERDFGMEARVASLNPLASPDPLPSMSPSGVVQTTVIRGDVSNSTLLPLHSAGSWNQLQSLISGKSMSGNLVLSPRGTKSSFSPRIGETPLTGQYGGDVSEEHSASMSSQGRMFSRIGIKGIGPHGDVKAPETTCVHLISPASDGPSSAAPLAESPLLVFSPPNPPLPGSPGASPASSMHVKDDSGKLCSILSRTDEKDSMNGQAGLPATGQTPGSFQTFETEETTTHRHSGSKIQDAAVDAVTFSDVGGPDSESVSEAPVGCETEKILDTGSDAPGRPDIGQHLAPSHSGAFDSRLKRRSPLYTENVDERSSSFRSSSDSEQSEDVEEASSLHEL